MRISNSVTKLCALKTFAKKKKMFRPNMRGKRKNKWELDSVGGPLVNERSRNQTDKIASHV